MLKTLDEMQSSDQLRTLNRRDLQLKQTPNLSEMPKDQKRLAIGARAAATTSRNCNAAPICFLRFVHPTELNGERRQSREIEEIKRGREALRYSVEEK
ncbi:MAG TPA: hypothetical protein VHX49_17255 [Candidatus Acidoferrales bacterium]|nr:hypothetical protein [Candidatus Acidoferrales bacterium]